MIGQPPDIAVLEQIQRRVLWLAVRMVDAANRERPNDDGVKVGGHQASSASLVTALTALYFAHLSPADRVSVKPHASPAFHAIQYLQGSLDRSYLTRFRTKGGLQSYPSRTKDPDEVDFSTGSVGHGAVAPLFAAAVRRYVDAHFGDRPTSRFIAVLGDAELDEGNIWEAIADPVTDRLGNVMWVIDFNRQSLDRVIPGVRIQQWRRQFEAAGWHVVEAKYGRRLAEAFTATPGGAELHEWLDAMSNEHYQSLFGHHGDDFRKRFLDGAPENLARVVAAIPDGDLETLIQDLGGHDFETLLDAYRQCDEVTDRPSVVFAYTIKGWGLPVAGNPRNHSALLTGEQVQVLREELGLTGDTEWDRIDPATPAGELASRRGRALQRFSAGEQPTVEVPQSTGVRATKPISTQEAFGRIVVGLSRDPAVAPYLVSTAPDVATNTNLGGFINKFGVFAPTDKRSWGDDAMLRWIESPRGQHIELGISEMNLFGLLGQLGLSGDLSGQPLIPLGTVYDPFVCRGLDSFIYAAYSGARFIVAGTPSGVSLAPEGGAHQSTITASIGMELPNTTLIEPAYAGALDWLLCDAAERVVASERDGGAYYFRLTTRPLDQAPFAAAQDRLGDAVLRREVLAGAYRLVDASDLAAHGAPVVYLAVSGPVVAETLTAAQELAEEGVAAHVVEVTSPGRLYTAWHGTLRDGVRTAATPAGAGALRAVFADRAPVVTVHDAASHGLAWLGSALGVPCVPLGVDRFGQSGTVADLYSEHDLLPGSIVNAALAALSLR